LRFVIPNLLSDVKFNKTYCTFRREGIEEE